MVPKPSNLNMIFLAGRENLFASQTWFFCQLQCVGANHQNMVSILVLFHYVGVFKFKPWEVYHKLNFSFSELQIEL